MGGPYNIHIGIVNGWQFAHPATTIQHIHPAGKQFSLSAHPYRCYRSTFGPANFPHTNVGATKLPDGTPAEIKSGPSWTALIFCGM
jgi:hypothetical protein